MLGWTRLLRRRGLSPVERARSRAGDDRAERRESVEAHRGPARRLAHRIRQAPAGREAGELRRRRSRLRPLRLARRPCAGRQADPSQGRPRLRSLADGGREPSAAGGVEPPLQRDEVHAQGGERPGRAQARGVAHRASSVTDSGKGGIDLPSSCRTSSIASGRRIRAPRARMAAWGSGCRSRRTWWSCTGARSPRTATVAERGPPSPYVFNGGSAPRSPPAPDRTRPPRVGENLPELVGPCRCSSLTTSRTRASWSRRCSSLCGARGGARGILWRRPVYDQRAREPLAPT